MTTTEAPAVPAAKRTSPLTAGGTRIAVTIGGIAAVGLVLIYLLGDREPALVTQYLVSGLLLGGVYALVSLGLTLIFGVLGIVNFAQGAMLTLSMYLVYVLQSSMGLNLYLAVVLTIPLLFGFGWLVQSVLLNRLTSDASHDRPLLVTLGLSLLIVNVLLMIFGGRPKNVDAPISGSVQILGALADTQRIIAFLGAVVVAAGLTLVLRKTSMGLAIRAVAANGTGAALVGVNVNRVYALTFGLGAASVAVAGGLITPFTTLVPTAGEQFTTLAFVIVVLGGLGSIPGALVGGLFIGVLQTVGSLYLPGSGSLLLVFGIFVLILFLRPQGLFGAKQ
ncbi:branched-chain amino acid transport system permease protein [Arthrobacter sp. UYP6]|uniref:branched-chain amino acid ABC transporter permease n=1 Tax=Arthrobacter sp. UYP6 TaxID=1756378 RepID=UPI003393288D